MQDLTTEGSPGGGEDSSHVNILGLTAASLHHFLCLVSISGSGTLASWDRKSKYQTNHSAITMDRQNIDRVIRVTLPVLGLIALVFTAPLSGLGQTGQPFKKHDWNRPRPPVVDPGTPSTQEQPGKPPSDASVLFDGKDLNQWGAMDGSPTKWVIKDGVMECVAGSGMIRTLQSFGDCQLHLEYAAPAPPRGRSQGRGNSGVFLMSTYEIQVLDNFDNPTYADGYDAAIYGQFPPLVNACRPPGQWQSYDVIFTRPRFDDKGQVVSPARITLLHNGVLVQNNVALLGNTPYMQRPEYRPHADKLPLALQDHGNPVRYRNIWVRELGSDALQKEFSFSTQVLDRLVGSYVVNPRLTVVIARKGGQLFMRLISPGGDTEFSLLAESATKFFLKDVDSTVTFQVNDQGVAESLDYYMGGDTNHGKKTK